MRPCSVEIAFASTGQRGSRRPPAHTVSVCASSAARCWRITVGQLRYHRRPMADPERASNPRTEVIAGITTFFTMAYIVIVNPTILSTPGTGMPFSGVLTATVLVCSTMTLLMGLYAQAAVRRRAGHGAERVLHLHDHPAGRRAVAGRARDRLLGGRAVPARVGDAAARDDRAGDSRRRCGSRPRPASACCSRSSACRTPGSSPTIRRRSSASGALDHRALLTLARPRDHRRGSSRRGNPLAYLASIFVVTAIAWVGGWVHAARDDGSARRTSRRCSSSSICSGALQLALVPAIVTVMMTDLFDSLSTFIGVAQAARAARRRRATEQPAQGSDRRFAGDARRGTVRQLVRARRTSRASPASAWAAAPDSPRWSPACAFCPVSSSRRSPRAVPPYATAAVLIMVGVAMFQTVSRHRVRSRSKWRVPAFATLVLIPLTFSITQGILWGFILHAALHAGRRPRARGRRARSGRWRPCPSALLVLEHAAMSSIPDSRRRDRRVAEDQEARRQVHRAARRRRSCG